MLDHLRRSAKAAAVAGLSLCAALALGTAPAQALAIDDLQDTQVVNSGASSSSDTVNLGNGFDRTIMVDGLGGAATVTVDGGKLTTSASGSGIYTLSSWIPTSGSLDLTGATLDILFDTVNSPPVASFHMSLGLFDQSTSNFVDLLGHLDPLPASGHVFQTAVSAFVGVDATDITEIQLSFAAEPDNNLVLGDGASFGITAEGAGAEVPLPLPGLLLCAGLLGLGGLARRPRPDVPLLRRSPALRAS